MGVNGSPEYGLTWREVDMPAGVPICALRARGRPTSGSGFTGWPSPVKEDARSSARHGYMKTGHQGTTLLDAARLAGWPTPITNDAEKRGVPSDPGSLSGAAHLAGGATPTTRDYRSESATDEYNEKRWSHTRGKPLSAEATLASGSPVTSSPAATARRAALAPAFSLWLQGYPTAWARCAERVIRLSRR
jgi:hypothetical protein